LAKKKISEKEKLSQAEDALKRVQAEFENYIKRSEKQAQDAREQGFAQAVLKILPVLDSIDAAIENAKKAEKFEKEEAIKGFENLREQAISTMAEKGLKAIACVGTDFDAKFADAMLVEKDQSKKDNLVLEELQKGYMFNETVLRHAKVKINKLEE
jgi:molecular chaperone GrpE